MTAEAVAYHYLYKSDLDQLPETELAIEPGEVYIARGTLTITPTSDEFTDDFLQSIFISNDMTFKAVGTKKNFSNTIQELVRADGSYSYTPILALVEVQSTDTESYGSHFHALVEDIPQNTED